MQPGSDIDEFIILFGDEEQKKCLKDESIANSKLTYLFGDAIRFVDDESQTQSVSFKTNVSELIKFYECKRNEDVKAHADPILRQPCHFIPASTPPKRTTFSFAPQPNSPQKLDLNLPTSSGGLVSPKSPTGIRHAGPPVKSLIQSFETKISSTSSAPNTVNDTTLLLPQHCLGSAKSNLIQSTPVRIDTAFSHLKETTVPSFESCEIPRLKWSISTSLTTSDLSQKTDNVVTFNAIAVEAVTAVISAAARTPDFVPPHSRSKDFNASVISDLATDLLPPLLLAVDPLRELARRNGGVSKYRALIKWCQNRLSRFQGVKVMNFSSSWVDGLALSALLYTYAPQMIAKCWEEVVYEMDTEKRFEVAFKVAKSLGIPTMLDLEEMLANGLPKWTHVMDYIASIYRQFEVSVECSS